METQSKYLDWIKKHKTVLSIRALNAHIGLKAYTLDRWFQGLRPIQGDNLKKLDRKMAAMVPLSTEGILQQLIQGLVVEYKVNERLTQEMTTDQRQCDMLNARSEQAFDTLIRLYLIAYQVSPDLASLIYDQICPLKPALMEGIQAMLENPRIKKKTPEAFLQEARKGMISALGAELKPIT